MSAAKWWGLWYGGSSYANPEDEDAEPFASIREACATFEARAGGWASPATPCVEQVPPDQGGPSTLLYREDPRQQSDPYPDREISFGPRGGVRVVRC